MKCPLRIFALEWGTEATGHLLPLKLTSDPCGAPFRKPESQIVVKDLALDRQWTTATVPRYH